MVRMMDAPPLEAQLLQRIQEAFPLTERPFAELGRSLGITEEETIALYRRLREEKVIRQTSAILDTKKLGYDSSLVAMMVDEDKLDAAAELINAHPGVSHNYRRAHPFNLWFTIAVPPDSALGLAKSVEWLSQRVGATKTMLLPTLKMFKIAVRLDVAKTRGLKESVAAKESVSIELEPLHYRIIGLIQDDLEACAEPFARIVDRLGIGYAEFFERMEELAKGGTMRRYATILNHRRAGFVANAMVVWNVDDATALEKGAKAAEFSAVSHCYLRPRQEGWPYNLFTMVHASSTEEIDGVIATMASELGDPEHFVLTSVQEYKKVRIRYFTDDIYEWEKQAGA